MLTRTGWPLRMPAKTKSSTLLSLTCSVSSVARNRGTGTRVAGVCSHRETVARLDFIRRGRAAGLTLTQIREVLQIRDTGRAPCQHVRRLLAERLAGLDAQIASLQDLRTTVSQIHDGVDVADPDTSDTDQVCRYL